MIRAETVDIMAVAIPETHVWVVVLAWIGCYVCGRWIAGVR